MNISLRNRWRLFTQQMSQNDGGGAAAIWGAITGTLANQTDLQNALDNKLK